MFDDGCEVVWDHGSCDLQNHHSWWSRVRRYQSSPSERSECSDCNNSCKFNQFCKTLLFCPIIATFRQIWPLIASSCVFHQSQRFPVQTSYSTYRSWWTDSVFIYLLCSSWAFSVRLQDTLKTKVQFYCPWHNLLSLCLNNSGKITDNVSTQIQRIHQIEVYKKAQG